MSVRMITDRGTTRTKDDVSESIPVMLMLYCHSAAKTQGYLSEN